MTDENIRAIILVKAVEIFSQKGYHGTHMRDIAGAAECSLPTLYYHYKSKNDLFDEIVLNEFKKIREKMREGFQFTDPPDQAYARSIKQLKTLTPYEKAVFKMVIKVLLGLEGSESARAELLAWEQNRVADNRKILDRFVSDPAIREDFAALYVRVTENMLEKIILLDEVIPDEVIERQLALLFQLAR